VETAGGIQEAKYVESWPNTTSAWAGWSRFDIPVHRSDGVHSLLVCTSSTLESPTCHVTRLDSRKILIEQNNKKQTEPALCVLCGRDARLTRPQPLPCLTSTVHTVYSIRPIHWNIKSAPVSPGRSRVGPALYVLSLLGTVRL
jgi:hypothetical protein